jgi:hypothetical protein
MGDVKRARRIFSWGGSICSPPAFRALLVACSARWWRVASRKQDASVPRREEELEFGLMRQEEFQAKQDRDGIAWRIAVGELGHQGQGAAEIRRLVRREPNVDTAEVASLSGPRGLYSRDGLPAQTFLLRMERND